MTLQVGSVLLGDSWFVYGLFETDSGATRYIGKTHHPYLRYYTHMGLAPGVRTSSVRDWVASVKARGAEVGLKILAVCETNEEACHVEMALISQMKDSLVNKPAAPAAPHPHRSAKPKKPPEPLKEPPAPLPGASITQKVAYRVALLGGPKPRVRSPRQRLP